MPWLVVKRCVPALSLILLLAGCGKEEPLPPIIEPGPWFPVYPGSWWKYEVNDSSMSMASTSSEYKVDSYIIYEDPDRYSDPFRVPFLNGVPIYGYYFVEEVGYPDSYYGIHELWPILSDKIGDVFDAYWIDKRYGSPVEVVRVKSKTFNGKDSVLLLESKWETWNSPVPVWPEKRTRVFTKGIGLTSDILVDTVNSDTLSKKILMDYFVNHSF